MGLSLGDCPNCGTSDWRLGPEYNFDTNKGDRRSVSAQSPGVFRTAVCNRCGLTWFFDAATLAS